MAGLILLLITDAIAQRHEVERLYIPDEALNRRTPVRVEGHVCYENDRIGKCFSCCSRQSDRIENGIM